MKEVKACLKKAYFWIILLVVLVLVNSFFFSGIIFNQRMPKVESIGNTVVLRYSQKSRSYRIEGLENGVFSSNGELHTFYSDDYLIREDGEPYTIVDAKGNSIGSISLKQNNGFASVYELDLSTTQESLVKIPASCEAVKIFATGEKKEYSVSVQIESRTTPIEVEFRDVTVRAPMMSPVLYSVSDAPVNVRIVGDVTLQGGENTLTTENYSTKDQLLSTLDTAANAYCVCMISAIGTAASIVKGLDYYRDMFRGVTSLQLQTMGNAWGKVDELVNGRDGYQGLDGVSAILTMSELCLVGDANAKLTLIGGNGSDGGDGTVGLMTKNDGGDGGNGGAALICDTLVCNLGSRISFSSGEGGKGGNGGRSATGYGKSGENGGKNEPKAVLSEEILFS